VKVAELRQFLVSLADPLEGAGGKQAATDLRRAAEGLGPFAEMPVSAFADFLAQANQFVQTGALPTSGGRKRSPAKAADGEAVRAAAEAYRQLYERSADPGLTDGQVEAGLKALDKLSKDAVIAVAREAGVQKSLKTKKDALAELRRRVVERRSTHERVRLGVEPPAAGPTPSPI
jgi:hypothetical protein